MIQDLIDRLLELLGIYGSVKLHIVSVTIPGIVGGDITLAAGDAVGDMFEIDVPEYGFIENFKLIDPDDDVLALTAHFFTKPFAAAANSAAFSISAADALYWVTSVTFDPTTDIGGAKVAEEVGTSYYHAPLKKLYGQCSTTGTPNIADNLLPVLTVGIRAGVKA